MEFLDPIAIISGIVLALSAIFGIAYEMAGSKRDQATETKMVITGIFTFTFLVSFGIFIVRVLALIG